MNLKGCEYVCNYCNCYYKTYKTRWEHIKKYHSTSKNDMSSFGIHFGIHDVIIQPKNNCKYCDKLLSTRQNRWRHEKTCNQKKELQPITNNITNINNIYDNRKLVNIFINGVGYENLKDIPYDDVKKILSNGGGKSILDYIKSVYFNKQLPENHSFCTTNIKSSFLNVMNNETKIPELHQKKYYFDELIKKVKDIIIELYKNYISDEFVINNQENIKDMIDSNKNFVDKFYSDKLLNGLIKEIEALTYNNRKIVKETWEGKNNNYLLIRKIRKLIKKIESVKILNIKTYNLIIKTLIIKIETTK
jgi:hypothetical protein